MGLVNSGASESYNVQGIEIAKQVESSKLKVKWNEIPQGGTESQNSPLIVKATLGRHPLECVE